MELESIKNEINSLESEELWELFGFVQDKLNNLPNVDTKNFPAERGKSFFLRYMSLKFPELSIKRMPSNNKNFEFLADNGIRYRVKTIRERSNTTGKFQSATFNSKEFDYLMVIIINDQFQVLEMLKFDWEIVKEYKRYDKSMNSYGFPLNNLTREKSIQMFSSPSLNE